MAGDQATRINQYLFSLLREDFESPDPETRKKAIYTLGRLGRGREVLARLQSIAASDESPEVRYTAKKALNYWSEVFEAADAGGDYLDLDGRDGLLDVEKLRSVLESGDSSRQFLAIMEVVQRGEEVALPLIRERLPREDDPWVVSMLVKAVGALGNRADVTTLQPFIHHRNARVVANCVEALDMLGDELVVAMVRPLLTSEDNRVRANAVKTIHRWDPVVALENLRDMARSKREWMRDSAIYCLKVIDSPLCEEILASMLEEEPSVDLRERILDVLELKGGRLAAGALQALHEAGGADEGSRPAELLRSLALRLDLDGEALAALAADHRRRRDEARAAAAARAAERTATAAPAPPAPPPPWWARFLASPVSQRLSYVVPGVLGLLLLGYVVVTVTGRASGPSMVSETVDFLERYEEAPDPTRFHGVPVRLRGRVTSAPTDRKLRLVHGRFVLDVTLARPLVDAETFPRGTWVAVDGTIRGRGITGDVFVDGEKVTLTDPPQVAARPSPTPTAEPDDGSEGGEATVAEPPSADTTATTTTP